ncbi:putative gustatory receptor 59f [Anastrepha obliqua]|uniref:putative gustatory receptor 59f n=1 Tax=Anastrepha obliqua TaxID=95512 RepID=UPI002409EB04|nr:putative gustatory receptor 59f [Anastrepha obliqua]
MLSAIVQGSTKTRKKSQKRTQFFLPSVKSTVNEVEVYLYRSVYNFLLLSEFFACLPYGVHRHLPTSKLSDHILKLLHVTWCTVIYAILVVNIYSEYTLSNIDLPTVQKPLYFAEYIVYLGHVLQIILATYWAHHKCARFLRTIAEFDHKLISFGKQPQYQQLRRFIRSHLGLITLYLISTLIVDYFYSDCNILNYIRSVIVYLLPNLIICCSLVQYYTLLYAITQRAIWLNEILHSELTQKKDPRDLRQRLQSIRILYSALQVFTKEVNNSFALSLVLVYIGSVTNLSVNVFLIYKYVDDTNNSTFSWIMYSVIWTAMHISKMFLILYYNYGVQGQKKQTAIIMNEIELQNSEMEETVTQFTLQLIINTRTNIVCGVAELNMNFITSLLVTMSTVFIFLLQYDITYEAITQTHKSGSPNRI